MTRKADNPGIRFTVTHPARQHPILALQKTAGNQSVLRWLRTPTTELVPVPKPVPPAGRDTTTAERVWPRVIPAVVATMLVALGLYTYFLR